MSTRSGRRRAATALALAAVTLVAATGCGGGSSTSGDGQVDLVFRQFDPPNEISGLEKAVDTWNRENPGIQVKLENIAAADAVTQYTREAQIRSGPDIVQLPFVAPKDLAENKLLLDLTAQAKKGESGDLGKFLGSELMSVDGATYALPWTADTFALTYQQDMLDEAGVKVFPQTWDELDSAAKKLTKDGTYGFCFPAASSAASGVWFLANYHLWSNGKTFVEKKGDTYAVGASAADIKATIDYFNGFFASGANPKSSLGIDSWGDPEMVGAVAKGECAIGFMPPQTFRAARAQGGDALRSAPVPGGSVERISHLGGRALGINPNTEHADAAYEFLTYLTGEKAFGTYEQYPARESVLGDYEFPEGEEGYQEALPKARTFSTYINSPAQVTSMQEIVNRELGEVFSGQKDSQAAADNVVEQLTKLLEEK